MQAGLVCLLTDMWGHDQLFHHSWIQTTIVFCAIAMLYQLLGSAAFAGVGTLCVAMPLQAAVARRQRTVGSAAMKQTDTRVKIVTEILLGIRVIKLYVPLPRLCSCTPPDSRVASACRYAWESFFKRSVESARAKELKSLFRVFMWQVLNTMLFMSTPVLVALATFATYAHWLWVHCWHVPYKITWP